MSAGKQRVSTKKTFYYKEIQTHNIQECLGHRKHHSTGYSSSEGFGGRVEEALGNNISM